MKLGIVVLSAVLLLSGCSDNGGSDGDEGRGGGSPGGAVDTRAVELPAELAGLRDRSDVIEDQAGAERAETDRENAERSVALTKQWYDRAYDGAGFGMRTYADDELELVPTVIAVRAPAPGLTSGPVADPEVLGIEAGPSVPRHVESDGVECVEFSTVTVPAGQEVDPDRVVTGLCSATDGTNTVFVHGITGGREGQERAMELARAALEAID